MSFKRIKGYTISASIFVDLLHNQHSKLLPFFPLISFDRLLISLFFTLKKHYINKLVFIFIFKSNPKLTQMIVWINLLFLEKMKFQKIIHKK